MKTYEKPRLSVLSINGSDQLCGTCADKPNGQTLYDNESLRNLLLGAGDTNYDDVLSREEAEQLFGSGTDACRNPVEGYCKFQSSGEGILIVAWS